MWGRRDGRATAGSRRLFVVFAAVLILPVAVLGVLLDQVNKAGADDRALDDARSISRLLAQMSVQPAVAGRDLEAGLDVSGVTDLGAAAEEALTQGRIISLTVRSPSGTVVFPPQSVGAGQESGVLRDALATATSSDQPARRTWTTRQSRFGGGRVQAIQVFAPVVAPSGSRVIGTLEVFLPYDSVAAQVEEQRNAFGGLLLGGLAILYGIVALLAWQVTRRLNRQLVATDHLAKHDTLTNLPNRSLHQARGEQEVERWRKESRRGRSARPVVVAIVDLDRFKHVNDTLGHAVGDELLRVVARRLRAVVRTDDVVARLGGDEFGLILPGARLADVMGILHRVRQALSEPVEIDGRVLPMSGSIGAAEAGLHGDSFDVLMRQADRAMYRAKRTGKGLATATASTHDDDADALVAGSDLAAGIQDGQLVLHYQPVIDARSGEPVALEALVRWQHPTLGLLAPGAFLGVAEQSGSIHALTHWVLHRALADLATLPDHLGIAVNVSPSTLADSTFPQRVVDALVTAGVSPERLTLEMTESATVRDVESLAGSLSRLRALGVQLSLDDFGQGSTSLSFLGRLPLTEVKIDRQFVATSPGDPLHGTIVDSVVKIAAAAGVQTVAEGVEDAEILGRVVALGCDRVQGWHLGRPAGVEDLRDRLDPDGERGVGPDDAAGVLTGSGDGS